MNKVDNLPLAVKGIEDGTISEEALRDLQKRVGMELRVNIFSMKSHQKMRYENSPMGLVMKISFGGISHTRNKVPIKTLLRLLLG